MTAIKALLLISLICVSSANPASEQPKPAPTENAGVADVAVKLASLQAEVQSVNSGQKEIKAVVQSSAESERNAVSEVKSQTQPVSSIPELLSTLKDQQKTLSGVAASQQEVLTSLKTQAEHLVTIKQQQAAAPKPTADAETTSATPKQLQTLQESAVKHSSALDAISTRLDQIKDAASNNKPAAKDTGCETAVASLKQETVAKLSSLEKDVAELKKLVNGLVEAGAKQSESLKAVLANQEKVLDALSKQASWSASQYLQHFKSVAAYYAANIGTISKEKAGEAWVLVKESYYSLVPIVSEQARHLQANAGVIAHKSFVLGREFTLEKHAELTKVIEDQFAQPHSRAWFAAISIIALAFFLAALILFFILRTLCSCCCGCGKKSKNAKVLTDTRSTGASAKRVKKDN